MRGGSTRALSDAEERGVARVRADLIDTVDPRWQRLLARARHDVYHLPGYIEHAARHEGGTPAALHAEAGEHALLVPVLVRPLPRELGAPADWVDAATPYGYPGPLVTPGADESTLAALVGALAPLCRAHSIVTVFARLHPILTFPRRVLADTGALVHHGETVAIDLGPPTAALDRQLRKNHRQVVRRLREAGYTVVRDDWSRIDAFWEIYDETMRRVGARSCYRLPPAYFRGLRDALRGRLHLACVLSPSGEVASVSMDSELGGIVQALFAGTAAAHLKAAPDRLLVVSLRDWAKARGATVLHLGGGLGGRRDALFDYKAGFGPGRAVFVTWRLVADHARYDELLGLRPSAGEGTPDPAFFPLYRSPASE
ncbi:MAG TPA: GNAT family N-acetyltransferase [Methylomirabilota bacterium]